MKFFFVLYLLLGLGSILLTSLFSLFYITGECYRFLHRGLAEIMKLSGWYEPTLAIPEGCTGKRRGRSKENQHVDSLHNTPATLPLCKHWSPSCVDHKKVYSSLQTCQCQSLQTFPVGNWWQSVICAFNCVTRFSASFCQSSEIQRQLLVRIMIFTKHLSHLIQSISTTTVATNV